MSDRLADEAKTAVASFLVSTDQYLDRDCLAIFQDKLEFDGNPYRCALFGLNEYCRVSYDEVFLGYILYISNDCEGAVATRLVDGSLDLVKLFGITASAQKEVRLLFGKEKNAAKRSHRSSVTLLLKYASLALEVLRRHTPVLKAFDPKLSFAFVKAICGIQGEGNLGSTLPDFEDLCSRWNTAVEAFHECVLANPGGKHSLDKVHGEAWHDYDDDDPPTPPLTRKRMMQASDGFMALHSVKAGFEELFSRGYLDVQLAITPCQDTAPNVDVREQTMEFGRHKSRAIGVYGDFISPAFQKHLMDEVRNNMRFAKSPVGAGSRRIRVSSVNPNHYFLMSGYPIQAVPFSPIEEELCRIGNHFMSPVNEAIRVYCLKNGLEFNENLLFHVDEMKMLGGPGLDTAYKLHSDVDCLLCDDMTAESEEQLGRHKVTAGDVQVLTLVVSDLQKSHGGRVEWYHPDDKDVANRLGMLPTYGTMAHYQSLELQRAKHKVVFLGDLQSGHGFRLIITFRYTGPFQLTPEMLAGRFQTFGVRSTDWITHKDYIYDVKGDPFPGDDLNSHSRSVVVSFPGVGGATSRASLAKLGSTVARRRIHLPSDRFRPHKSARRDSDVGKLFRECYYISIDRHTWEILASYEYMTRSIAMRNHLFVDVQLKRKTRTKPAVKERVMHGPLLAPSADGNEGVLELVRPGTVYDASDAASGLSLFHKTQRRGFVRTEHAAVVADVYIQFLYRNGVRAFVDYVRFWQAGMELVNNAIKRMSEGTPVTPHEIRQLEKKAPRFWIGSNGGGSVLAGQKGCPRLDSDLASKEMPDAYAGGGRKNTPQNRALESVFYRDGCLRVFAQLNPTDDFVIREQLLMGRCGNLPVSLYAGTARIVDVEHNPQSMEDILADVEGLGLSHADKKFLEFRRKRHDRYIMEDILTPLDLLHDHVQSHKELWSLLPCSFTPLPPWSPMVVSDRDVADVGVSQPGMVPCAAQSADGTSTSATTQAVSCNEYLSMASPHYMEQGEIRDNFFEQKAYKALMPESISDECEEEVELSSGLNVSVKDIITAAQHAMVATAARIRRHNVYENDSCVGYLAGPTFSGLCAVARTSTFHSPMRRHDLSCAFIRKSTENMLFDVYGCSLLEARDIIVNGHVPSYLRARFDCTGDPGAQIVRDVEYGIFTFRVTGKPFPFERWNMNFRDSGRCKGSMGEVGEAHCDDKDDDVKLEDMKQPMMETEPVEATHDEDMAISTDGMDVVNVDSGPTDVCEPVADSGPSIDMEMDMKLPASLCDKSAQCDHHFKGDSKPSDELSAEPSSELGTNAGGNGTDRILEAPAMPTDGAPATSSPRADGAVAAMVSPVKGGADDRGRLQYSMEGETTKERIEFIRVRHAVEAALQTNLPIDKVRRLRVEVVRNLRARHAAGVTEVGKQLDFGTVKLVVEAVLVTNLAAEIAADLRICLTRTVTANRTITANRSHTATANCTIGGTTSSNFARPNGADFRLAEGGNTHSEGSPFPNSSDRDDSSGQVFHPADGAFPCACGDHQRNIPFLPRPTEAVHFADYFEATCMESDGTIKNMKGWTGRGDAGSIPCDLKRPRLCKNFFLNCAKNINDLANSHVEEARMVDQNGGTKRENAVQASQRYIESHLQAENLHGTEFKASQVSVFLVFCLSAAHYMWCHLIYFRHSRYLISRKFGHVSLAIMMLCIQHMVVTRDLRLVPIAAVLVMFAGPSSSI